MDDVSDFFLCFEHGRLLVAAPETSFRPPHPLANAWFRESLKNAPAQLSQVRCHMHRVQFSVLK